MKQLLERMESKSLSLIKKDDDNISYKSAEELFRNKKRISLNDINMLSPQEISRSKAIIAYNFEILTGEARDVFMDKIEPFLIESDNHNIIWERNHHRINQAITCHIQATNSLPSITTLSRRTGLSRTTIYSHLKEIDTNRFIQEENLKLKAIYADVFGAISKEAISGNIQAAKLFIEILHLRQNYTSATIIGQQQNNLTVNKV